MGKIGAKRKLFAGEILFVRGISKASWVLLEWFFAVGFAGRIECSVVVLGSILQVLSFL